MKERPFGDTYTLTSFLLSSGQDSSYPLLGAPSIGIERLNLVKRRQISAYVDVPLNLFRVRKQYDDQGFLWIFE